MKKLLALALCGLLAVVAVAQDAPAPEGERSSNERVAWVRGLLEVSGPQHLALVLDGSQLTRGRRAQFIRSAAIECVKLLRETDVVSVVVYRSSPELLVPMQVARDKDAIIRKIQSIEPSGETALFAGIARAAEEVRQYKAVGRQDRILVLGGVLGNVGPQSADEIGILVSALAKEGISTYLPGMGIRSTRPRGSQE